MDLPSLCGSGRVCYLGGRRFLVRPLSLDAYGSVLAWLDDALPGREDRASPPRISDDESQKALSSPLGFLLLTYLALRDQGVTFEEAERLVLAADGIEQALLIHVLFSRRRTFQPCEGAENVATGWWGPSLVRLMGRYPAMALADIRAMTLDQMDCLVADGLPGEQPVETLPEITTEDPHAILERLRAEHPDFAATLDEQLGVSNGEAT